MILWAAITDYTFKKFDAEEEMSGRMCMKRIDSLLLKGDN